jgi:Protein of unknown function (DUF2752)
MQIVRRPLAPGETDHELVWFLVSAGTFVLAASWIALKLPWPICLFHALTGHPCATCGATRAAIAFFHGRFFAAWKWNPLAFVVYVALVIFNLYAFAIVITQAPRLRVLLASSEKKFLRVIVIALVLGNWIYLVAASPLA